jgi:hypothetical protein
VSAISPGEDREQTPTDRNSYPESQITRPPARLGAAQVLERAAWVQALMRDALTAGVDYATMPGWKQPDLLKPGAEKLLVAARLSSATALVDDDDARTHRGVRYVCTVTDRDGVLIARREGYAGYDESRFANDQGWRADWNNVLQMAQKRAMVAATKAALMASGLFADPDAAIPTVPAARRADRVPDHVYDDAPESTASAGDHGYRYDPRPAG